MIQPLPIELSRIDKLFMDQNGTALEESRRRRAQRGIDLVVGDDIRASYGLQLALLTAVNLGVKCFGGETKAHASSVVWLAPCLVPVVRAATLGEAVLELGGRPSVWSGLPPTGRYLVLGNAVAKAGAVRMTYDGWRIAVGPATEVPRMAERAYCQLASIASAAIAIGELFADFAGISITATRRVVTLSLWRPDLSADHPDGIGQQLDELPLAVGVFGLGHLGQAYLWGLASLPYYSKTDSTILLCDDDTVETPNVETGALLTPASVAHLKTRVAAAWLEARRFSTRLLERRVDKYFKRTEGEPAIALSGFDDNMPRQWLSEAGFNMIFDSGLGGESYNFDTIAFHTWPNPRPACEVWPLESPKELAAREARKTQQAASNAAYQALDSDECGRVLVAGKSVAVPFVGAVAACVVLAEMLKTVNGGPILSDLKLRLCSLGTGGPEGRLANEAAPPVRGVPTGPIKRVN